MITVAAGESQTFCPNNNGQSFRVCANGGVCGSVSGVVNGNAISAVQIGPTPLNQAFGPMVSGDFLTVAVQVGGATVFKVSPESEVDESPVGPFPDLPTLIADYPASGNAGKSAIAGPILYMDDGAAWFPVSLAVVDDVIPSDSDVVQVSLNNSGSQVVGCGGMLLTIRCTTGASVVLTVIDNPFGSTGRTVYTGTLSAGDVVAVNGYALHGLYASTPGAGAFEFDHKGAF